MVEFVGEMSIQRFLRPHKLTAKKTIETLPNGMCHFTVFDDDEQPLGSHDFSSAAIHEAFLDGLEENNELLESEAEFKAANAELFAKGQELRRENKKLSAENKELLAKNKELAKMVQAVRDLTHQFEDSDKAAEDAEELKQGGGEEDEVVVKRPPKRRNIKTKAVNPKKPKSHKPKRAPCFQVRWSDGVLAAVRAFLVDHKDGDYAWLASAIEDVKYKEGETPSTIRGFPDEFQKAWANFKLTACWGIFTATLFPDKVALLDDKLAKYHAKQLPPKVSNAEEDEEEGSEESAQEEEPDESPAAAAASGSESD
jgi:hypothetical protein